MKFFWIFRFFLPLQRSIFYPDIMIIMKRFFMTCVALAAFMLASSTQSLQDTIRIPLEKLNMPVNYCNAYWMNGKEELVRDTDDPTRVLKVNTDLKSDLPLSIDFSDPASVIYRFSDVYSEITVPVDSMKIYRKRKCGEAEGVTPEWNIGNYRKGNIDYSVWVIPDGNATFTSDSLKFLNDFLVKALIGNVYKGEIDTPDGPFRLTIHNPVENPNYAGNSDMPYPAVIPEGKYEDFSSYVPAISFGIKTVKERVPGSLVRLGQEDYYLIDSVTPDFKEIILSRSDSRPESVKINDDALAELKPYIDEASAMGKLLLVDFWGTWCNPCIAAMPKLKEIEEEFEDKLMVLSVINDHPKNFDRGKEILDKNGLAGKRLFREGEPLVSLLEVSAFPSYILLDKDGSLIMKGSSAQALDWVENCLER